MSTAASSTLDSQLFTTWGLNSYSDVSMVVPGGYSSRLWTNDSQPQFWSKYQVWEWLQQMMDMYQIDASSMPMHNFDIDGCQLCSMSYQDFLRAAGSAGAILYHSLTDLKLPGGWRPHRTCSPATVAILAPSCEKCKYLIKNELKTYKK
ncbi:unnamed protein product [Merluccius merluccius]